jgi:uncharacterized protein
LPDGDFVDIDWTTRTSGPIVILLHGLQGSSRSRYARGLLRAVHNAGWRGALIHFRGCSGEPNRLARAYHSGETGDLDYIVQLLIKREPTAPIGAVGVSLGGNVLLKWLGENGARAPIAAAVAISVPLLLDRAADKMARGFSRIYQWDLLRALRMALDTKRQQVTMQLAIEDLRDLRTLREFDNHVTAPLHGFRDADHYYRASSSRQYMRHIGVPTLLIQARNDPFMTPDVIPSPEEVAPCVTLDVHDSGGHVGFVMGSVPWRARYWLEERVPEFLALHFITALQNDTSPRAMDLADLLSPGG